MWIYQYGSDLDHLYAGLKSHARIGIGGLVPVIQSDRFKAHHAIVALAQVVQKYNVHAHFFGVSTPSILAALHTMLPDYSVDSTTWLTGARYGLLINRQGSSTQRVIWAMTLIERQFFYKILRR